MSPIPFTDFVDRCLYDPAFGYYGSGVVAFGHPSHYSTYPQRLSPGFGWMLADALAWLLEAPLRDGRIPADAPLTILEIGAGDGALARDTLDRLEALRDCPRAGPLAARVRYVVGDRSPALRARQRRTLARHIAAGRAEVKHLDGRSPSWDGPFHGVVVCNELLSNLTCDKLWLHADGRVSGVGVAARPAMSPEALWEAIAAGAPPPLEEVPLACADDPARAAYLAALAPLVDDLHALGHDPVALHYNAGIPAFLAGVAPCLVAPGNFGLALVVDYGGTSRHVLDPRVAHLRLYGRPGARSMLETPGRLDITWDVDFTQLGLVAAEHGVRLQHLGHQSMLESAAADLWGPALRPHLEAGRVVEGAAPGEEAALEAERLVGEFREADGFRAAVLAPPGYTTPTLRFGPGDPWAPDALVTVSPDADPAAMRRALEGLPLPDVAAWLHPGCDPLANLNAVGAYALRAEALRRLAPFLVPPGALARRPGAPRAT